MRGGHPTLPRRSALEGAGLQRMPGPQRKTPIGRRVGDGRGGACRGIYGRGCAQPVSISESLAALLHRVVQSEPSPLRLFPQRAESSAAWVPPSYSVAPHISPTPGALRAFPRRCVVSGGLFVCFLLSPLCCSTTGVSGAPHSEGSSASGEGRLRRTARAPPADQRAGAPTRRPLPPPAFVRRGEPAASSLMHPFQWCNGESRGGSARRSPRTRSGCNT